MWGKLTKKINRNKSRIINDPHVLYIFIAMPELKVVNLLFANKSVVWASWRISAEDKIPNLRQTKEVVGPFMTADARILLYVYLDRLQENGIYSDRALYPIYRNMTSDL